MGKQQKGFLKCCLRHTVLSVWEHQFCISVPFCTFKNEEEQISVIGETEIERFIEEQKAEKSGRKATLASTTGIRYSADFLAKWDVRCWISNEKVDPKNWNYYHPDTFLNELNKAKVMENDERFFQFENPEIFKQFVGDDFEKTFKETYGFDFVAKMPLTEGKSTILPCSKDCLKQEKSEFAKDCKKKGGLFQCCVKRIDLGNFEYARLHYLKPDRVERHCYEDINNRDVSKCVFCTATYSCKYWEGSRIKTDYMSAEVNALGGLYMNELDGQTEPQRIGFRDIACLKQDYCNMDIETYRDADFHTAATYQEFCQLKVNLKSDISPTSSSHSTYQIENKEKQACEKRKTIVRVCRKKILKELSNEALSDLNKELRRRKKTSKKKRKKRKESKKKKRKRRKKRSKRKRKRGRKKRRTRNMKYE